MESKSPLQPPTALEKIAGSVVTESTLTLVGVLSGSPLGALLPVLAKSLASERQRQRVEAALAEINSVLETQGEALRNLTDPQYKLINETILAFLHTTSVEKLSYLRRAVRNGLEMSAIQPEEAVVLSRVIRDISAEEADFLVRNFSYERIQLGVAEGPTIRGVLVVPAGGRDELILSGLISLGLIIPAGPTMDDQGIMRFSNSVAKLIALLWEPRI
jgi:hypothetical protein